MFRELQKRFFFAIFSLQRKRLSNHFTMGVVDKWHYRSVCFLKEKMPNICLVPKWASFYTQGFVWIRWFQHVSIISHIKHIIFLSYFSNIGKKNAVFGWSIPNFQRALVLFWPSSRWLPVFVWNALSMDPPGVVRHLGGWKLSGNRPSPGIMVCTLWLCQNSYWKWPLIVDFPIKHGDFP